MTEADSKVKLHEAPTEDPTPVWKRRRYFLVLMSFFGLFNVIALRVNLSVAIVVMTEIRTIEHPDGTQTVEQYFPWSSVQKGYILSSFLYGYLMTQILGGIIASRIGGHLLFGVGIGTTAVLTLLTPAAAHLSIFALITVRVVEGLFEGVTFACLFDMLSKWAPPNERARMVVCAFTGNYVGFVVCLPVSGLLVQSLGWESVFYVFGVVGCIWTVLWLIFMSKSPRADTWISTAERDYIESSLSSQTNNSRVSIPWKAIFSSTAVWAIVAAQFSEGWGFFTLQTQLPQFFNDVLNFQIMTSGIVSAIPYISISVMLPVAGFLADWVQNKGFWTIRQTRRYFICIAFIAQTICMMMAAFWLHPTASVVFISVGVGLASFAYSSFPVNYLDIAPQHAGVLVGICNSFASVAGIVSPILTGYIVTTPTDMEWKIIFFITSGVYLFGCIVYWFWAQGKVQPWALQTASPDEGNHDFSLPNK